MAYTGPKGPPTPAYKIAVLQNFSPNEDTVHELWTPVDSKEVVRLVSVRDKVKVYAKQDEVVAVPIQGDPCTACWAEGKVWEDEMVPKFVFCSLSGFQSPVEFLNWVFEPGEPVKAGYYMLEQKNAPDCTYEYLDDDVEIIWTPDDVLSTILVTTKPDNIIRMDVSAGGCFKRFEEDSLRAEITCYFKKA